MWSIWLATGKSAGRKICRFSSTTLEGDPYVLSVAVRPSLFSAEASCFLLETRLEDFIESPLVLNEFVILLRSSHPVPRSTLSRGSRK